jgi:hypothetical protein
MTHRAATIVKEREAQLAADAASRVAAHMTSEIQAKANAQLGPSLKPSSY